MTQQHKTYVAITIGDHVPGGRLNVTVEAASLHEAKSILEETYGKDTIFDLHNEEDSNKIRY